MAEAHAAVGFQFSITHEGWDLNLDREVLYLVWQSGVRSWKKRIARFLATLAYMMPVQSEYDSFEGCSELNSPQDMKTLILGQIMRKLENNVHNGIYPGHYSYLCVVIAMVSALHINGYHVPFDLPNKILWFMGDSLSYKHQLIACSITGFSYWLPVVYALRYTMRGLFMYRGWMYELDSNQKPSWKTKIWRTLVKTSSGWNTPKLYSYQLALPKLPLPSVHDTVRRYLASVRPLLEDEQYEKTEKLAADFENGIAKKLQRYLVLKSWWSSNYVSDWWEEYVYCRGRYPLIINSNYYGIDAILLQPTTKQAARAASVINSLLMFRRLVDRQELDPILLQDLVPLCSWQYERIFNTTRIPGEVADKIVHFPDSNHVAVYHKGRYFKVIIYHRGRILKPPEIQMQIEQILADQSDPQLGEEKLAALTAGERSHWAAVRRRYFDKGVNKLSLDAVERAAFFVTLDDYPYEYDMNDPSKLDSYGKMLLHGKGYDRWFDKSFNICVGTNGRIGFNAEHSWADAAVMAHVWEWVILEEAYEPRADAPILAHCLEHVLLDEAEMIRFDDSGNTLGNPEFTPPPPSRLNWDLNKECQHGIDISCRVANKLIEDIDLRIYAHDSYGKGFIKTCSLSPDAYIQMAFQLAYYRDAGKFCLAYEATMTRLFREGRTETVRPLTMESVAWIKAMENPHTSIEEKVDLLKIACTKQKKLCLDAKSGKGIDRHLFCLFIVSKHLELEVPFLKEVVSEPWRLASSQTPHGQTKRMDLNKYPKCISAGGGFGPIADDGYGISYIVAGEDIIFFHISNKKSCPTTDCHRFAIRIEQTLTDMRQLFMEYKRLNENK